MTRCGKRNNVLKGSSQRRRLFTDRVRRAIMKIEPDILNQLESDFPPDEIPVRVEQLVKATNDSRMQRCIVFASRGHPWYFDYLCRLVKVDFRDVILAAEYDRLDARLYDFSRPIPLARIDNPY